jgi:predicted RNA-binding Zn-ribbon protein involved in translation (DUF1610 family)
MKLRDLAALAPPQPMTEVDPEREAVRASKRARMRALIKDYTDPKIPARDKIMCVSCNERIGPGERFTVHFEPRMMLALIHCMRCDAEEPKHQWKRVIVKEV